MSMSSQVTSHSLTRVIREYSGTIRPYRYFSNHDDKAVALGPREVEFGKVK
jgi:hypothetical protein